MREAFDRDLNLTMNFLPIWFPVSHYCVFVIYLYSGVPNKHTGMLIYFGQKFRGYSYYFENILTITLLLFNEIKHSFCDVLYSTKASI